MGCVCVSKVMKKLNKWWSIVHLSCMASNGLPSSDSTVAAMCRGVSPASSIWSCGAPWSMYRSGRNMDLSCKEHKNLVSIYSDLIMYIYSC